MADIRGIFVELRTAGGRHAGTDDHIYVGVFGRGEAVNFPSTFAGSMTGNEVPTSGTGSGMFGKAPFWKAPKGPTRPAAGTIRKIAASIWRWSITST